MSTSVIDSVMEPLADCLTPEVALRIAALRAPPEAQQRIDEQATEMD